MADRLSAPGAIPLAWATPWWRSAAGTLSPPDYDSLVWLRHAAAQLGFILVIAFILIRLLKLGTERLQRLSKSQALPGGLRAQQLKTLASIIDSVGIVVIVFVAGMQILTVFDVDIKPLLASAGIAGLAIGFGAQTLVKDVINGFFILLENQYDIGDVVRLASVRGTVEAMTLRRTVLRDADGALHIIPNGQITIVSNLTRDWAQVTLHVAVAYSENSDRIIKLLQEVGAELRHDPRFAELMVADPEVPGIERVTGSEADYLMLVKTVPGSAQYTVSRELRRRIKECFEKQSVKAASPAQVYVINPESGRNEEIK
jgi:moderate conductance mechanosensitive channel